MPMKIIIELMDGTILKTNTGYTRLFPVGEDIEKCGGIEIDEIWYLKHTIKLIRKKE
ncbi:hypothetical protein [Paenibacillus glacialis]|uniref:hypothetical protein n=1 Tax=Paenibacillus glacialis TaxID=494026 RepID=UPI000A572D2F|nr:hypothetical protein [Paenibacillus glacialis]